MGVTARARSTTRTTRFCLRRWKLVGALMERLLPRHMQIIYLINAGHLDSARRRGFVDPGLLSSLSLIDEQAGRRVRMGNLAFIGSHKINGVPSALHTDLMRKTVFHSVNAVYPGRRRTRPTGSRSAAGSSSAIPGWRASSAQRSAIALSTLPRQIKGFAAYADDPSMQERVAAARREAKLTLSSYIASQLGQRIQSRSNVRRADQADSRIYDVSCSTSSRRSPATTPSAPIRPSNSPRASRSSPAKRRPATHRPSSSSSLRSTWRASSTPTRPCAVS